MEKKEMLEQLDELEQLYNKKKWQKKWQNEIKTFQKEIVNKLEEINIFIRDIINDIKKDRRERRLSKNE